MRTDMKRKDGTVVKQHNVITSFRGEKFVFSYGWRGKVICQPKADHDAGRHMPQALCPSVFGLEVVQK